MTTETEILTVVSGILMDAANTRWPWTELRYYLNQGQRVISSARIDACSETRLVFLSSGVKQTIPTDAWWLLSVIRNAPIAVVEGAQQPSGIRLCELENIADSAPDWANDTPSTTVKNYAYDERTPSIYYVWPPVSPGEYYSGAANTRVEIAVAVNPTATTTTSSPIAIGQQYEAMLMDYILWRAFSKDAGLPNGMARAQMHGQAFQAAMAMANQTALHGSPNAAIQGGVTPRSLQRAAA
jgi:hypothetical protein